MDSARVLPPVERSAIKEEGLMESSQRIDNVGIVSIVENTANNFTMPNSRTTLLNVYAQNAELPMLPGWSVLRINTSGYNDTL